MMRGFRSWSAAGIPRQAREKSMQAPGFQVSDASGGEVKGGPLVASRQERAARDAHDDEGRRRASGGEGENRAQWARWREPLVLFVTHQIRLWKILPGQNNPQLITSLGVWLRALSFPTATTSSSHRPRPETEDFVESLIAKECGTGRRRREGKTGRTTRGVGGTMRANCMGPPSFPGFQFQGCQDFSPRQTERVTVTDTATATGMTLTLDLT